MCQCLVNCVVDFPRKMSQAEQVPEDMPAYLKDEPVATGKFRNYMEVMIRPIHFTY